MLPCSRAVCALWDGGRAAQGGQPAETGPEGEGAGRTAHQLRGPAAPHPGADLVVGHLNILFYIFYYILVERFWVGITSARATYLPEGPNNPRLEPVRMPDLVLSHTFGRRQGRRDVLLQSRIAHVDLQAAVSVNHPSSTFQATRFHRKPPFDMQSTKITALPHHRLQWFSRELLGTQAQQACNGSTEAHAGTALGFQALRHFDAEVVCHCNPENFNVSLNFKTLVILAVKPQKQFLRCRQMTHHLISLATVWLEQM